MRNYWLRIVLGALVIFGVGMVVAKMFQRGKLAVHEIAEGSGPISVPVPGFVPFSLDGSRLGSIRRITMYRSAPKQPSGFVVSVNLPDSIASDRLARCILLVDTSQNTAGKDLVPFGTIVIRARGDSFPFLLPRAVVDDMRNPARPAVDSLTVTANTDSVRAADAPRPADSIRQTAPRAR